LVSDHAGVGNHSFGVICEWLIQPSSGLVSEITLNFFAPYYIGTIEIFDETNASVFYHYQSSPDGPLSATEYEQLFADLLAQPIVVSGCEAVNINVSFYVSPL